MPRRKISDQAAPLRDNNRIELTRLTSKQKKFCELILSGMNQTEAYWIAYDCRQTMSREAAQVQGSRLRNHPVIALWLDAATTEVLNAHQCTLTDHLKELARLKAIAVRTGNVGAAVQAEQLRGKVAGHYIDQIADVTYDPIKTLNELALTKPDLAKQLAQEHNIPWAPDPQTQH